MTTRPGFPPGSHVTVVPGEGVYVRTERGAVALRGGVYERLAPLLDGTRTRDALVDALAATTPAAEVYYALQQLVTRGYVCEIDAAGARADAGFWHALGLDAPQVTARLAATPVAVVAVGAVQTQGLVAALATLGLQVAPAGALAVVATDDYLQPALAVLNHDALRTGRPWLLCKPTGTILWVGPLFQPGASACWACLAQRLERHRARDAAVRARAGVAGPIVLPRSALRLTEDAALALAALQVAQAVGAPLAVDRMPVVVTLDLRTLTTQHHVVVRRPQCAQCGHPLDPARAPAPPRLRRHSASGTADTGHRLVAPETTFARYQHHLSPVTGLVSGLVRTLPGDEENGAGEESSLQVYRAGRDLPAFSDSRDPLWPDLRTRAVGKGVTEAQALTSGLCEALERYSGLFQGDEPRIRATCRSLGSRAIHPNACMLFSERQYSTAGPWSSAAPYRGAPDPFNEDAQTDWSPVWSLTERTFKYLPTSYCYYGFPRREEVRRSPMDSNGCAAGNTLDEAILQGFLELVERDSVALWWYNRIQRPGLDLDSFDDPYVKTLQRAYAQRHREVWALDLTSDLGVPAFVALSRQIDGNIEAITFGFGAHFDARLGLRRALTEMNQLLPGLDAMRSTAKIQEHTRDARRWWQTATVASEPYVTPASMVPRRRLQDFPLETDGDRSVDVSRCQAIAEQHQLDVLVLDQTRPDVGLSVVKVFVPGLRHFWSRFAPGRLYDVPVRLAWLATPREEEELNPVAMFL